ncbi:MAG: hypothetical protein HY080_16975 [Gammaproteobacteria bacterium]|nr:hypothetical protein [Gammaproteobacteria bacterium]
MRYARIGISLALVVWAGWQYHMAGFTSSAIIIAIWLSDFIASIASIPTYGIIRALHLEKKLVSWYTVYEYAGKPGSKNAKLSCWSDFASLAAVHVFMTAFCWLFLYLPEQQNDSNMIMINSTVVDFKSALHLLPTFLLGHIMTGGFHFNFNQRLYFNFYENYRQCGVWMLMPVALMPVIWTLKRALDWDIGWVILALFLLAKYIITPLFKGKLIGNPDGSVSFS